VRLVRQVCYGGYPVRQGGSGARGVRRCAPPDKRLERVAERGSANIPGAHARSLGQATSERRDGPRIREYLHRFRSPNAFGHRIGIMRGSGETERAAFRLIARVRPDGLLMDDAGRELGKDFIMRCIRREGVMRPVLWALTIGVGLGAASTAAANTLLFENSKITRLASPAVNLSDASNSVCLAWIVPETSAPPGAVSFSTLRRLVSTWRRTSTEHKAARSTPWVWIGRALTSPSSPVFSRPGLSP